MTNKKQYYVIMHETPDNDPKMLTRQYEDKHLALAHAKEYYELAPKETFTVFRKVRKWQPVDKYSKQRAVANTLIKAANMILEGIPK